MATISWEVQVTLAALTTRIDGVVPPLRFARPHQFHDRVHDRRRQEVPVCDQLAECIVLPAMFRPAIRRHVVTTFGTITYGNRDAGAIPAASISSVITRVIANICVDEGHG
jgi:hypothetical protein